LLGLGDPVQQRLQFWTICHFKKVVTSPIDLNLWSSLPGQRTALFSAEVLSPWSQFSRPRSSYDFAFILSPFATASSDVNSLLDSTLNRPSGTCGEYVPERPDSRSSEPRCRFSTRCAAGSWTQPGGLRLLRQVPFLTVPELRLIWTDGEERLVWTPKRTSPPHSVFPLPLAPLPGRRRGCSPRGHCPLSGLCTRLSPPSHPPFSSPQPR